MREITAMGDQTPEKPGPEESFKMKAIEEDTIDAEAHGLRRREPLTPPDAPGPDQGWRLKAIEDPAAADSSDS